MDEEKAQRMVQELPAIVRASEDEVPCPDCGEMVRSGLVRCWRCGGFLRKDIAETFQKMQDSPTPVTRTLVPDDLPDLESSPSDENSEDDFVLGDGVSFISSEELTRQQARHSAPAELPVDEEEDTYTLKPKAAEPKTTAAPGAGAPASESKPAAQTAGSEAPARKPEAEPAPAADPTPPPAPVSTGDPLLDIALQEERESDERRKDRRKKKSQTKAAAMPGFVFVFCPNGHRVQVEERYRGMTGRCPRCKSFFHVPALDWAKAQGGGADAEEVQKKESRFKSWSIDSHLHHLDPTRLKLKPGSMEKEFQEVDLGFADDAMLVVTHGKQNAGLFSGEKNKKKVDELREAVQEHLCEEKELLDLPAAGYRQYDATHMQKVSVVQPAAYVHESMFAGVPVFGEGRIAVRLPVTDADKDVKDILFVSFWLSEFRAFAKQLQTRYGIQDLGLLEGVPLEDNLSSYTCHYSDRPIQSVEATPFHQADPNLKLEIIGRKCQACGLVVSEDSRKKEKLGGANGKGIAKAPCPKCKQKFGEITLYGLPPAEEGATEATLKETGGIPTT